MSKKLPYFIFSALCLAWILLWAIDGAAIFNHSADYMVRFASHDQGYSFWAFIFTPYAAFLISFVLSALSAVLVTARREGHLLAITANIYLFVTLILNISTLKVLNGNIIVMMWAAAVILLALIAMFIISEFLNTPKVEAAPRTKAVPMMMPEQNENEVHRLNAEIPKLGEGVIRKERIKAKVNSTDIIQTDDNEILL